MDIISGHRNNLLIEISTQPFQPILMNSIFLLTVWDVSATYIVYIAMMKQILKL